MLSVLRENGVQGEVRKIANFVPLESIQLRGHPPAASHVLQVALSTEAEVKVFYPVIMMNWQIVQSVHLDISRPFRRHSTVVLAIPVPQGAGL